MKIVLIPPKMTPSKASKASKAARKTPSKKAMPKAPVVLDAPVIVDAPDAIDCLSTKGPNPFAYLSSDARTSLNLKSMQTAMCRCASCVAREKTKPTTPFCFATVSVFLWNLHPYEECTDLEEPRALLAVRCTLQLEQYPAESLLNDRVWWGDVSSGAHFDAKDRRRAGKKTRVEVGYHLKCLKPTVKEIPTGDWFCPECVLARTPVKATKESAKGSKESAKGSKESAKGSKESAKGFKESAKGSKESAKGSKESAKGSKAEVKGSKAEAKGSKAEAKVQKRKAAAVEGADVRSAKKAKVSKADTKEAAKEAAEKVAKEAAKETAEKAAEKAAKEAAKEAAKK
eukprot:1194271-Prorocentrum_minimum.AAC.4